MTKFADKLDAKIEQSRHGKLIAKRHIDRMAATIAVVRRDSGRFDIIRAFGIGQNVEVSIDASEVTAEAAFERLLGVIF